jgi:hypothetical protein
VEGIDTSEAEGPREAVERDWALERGLARVSEVDGLREENERVGWEVLVYVNAGGIGTWDRTNEVEGGGGCGT